MFTGLSFSGLPSVYDKLLLSESSSELSLVVSFCGVADVDELCLVITSFKILWDCDAAGELPCLIPNLLPDNLRNESSSKLGFGGEDADEKLLLINVNGGTAPTFSFTSNISFGANLSPEDGEIAAVDEPSTLPAVKSPLFELLVLESFKYEKF